MRMCGSSTFNSSSTQVVKVRLLESPIIQKIMKNCFSFVSPWDIGHEFEVDDKAAAGLSWIYRQASLSGQRLFLSGTGADEIVSDYGSKGVPFEPWTCLVLCCSNTGEADALSFHNGHKAWHKSFQVHYAVQVVPGCPFQLKRSISNALFESSFAGTSSDFHSFLYY